MSAVWLVSLVFVLGLGIGVFVFWFFFRETAKSKKPSAKSAAGRLSFRWKYILLPVVLLLLSVVLGAIFLPQLGDEVAYRFNLDGSPRSLLSRGWLASLTLIPQLIFMLVAYAVVWGTIRLSRSSGQTGDARNTERLVLFMGNMVALPQVVIGFVMLDIFSYNIYDSHLMPVWLFAVIATAVAGIILAIFFIKTIRRSRQRQ